MNKLLVNGCSYTAGSWQTVRPGSEISHIVWPNHLEDRFGTVVNLAKGGTGNDRIVRTTLDYCENNDMTDYVVIIQWSSPFRTEYWNSEQQEWTNVVIKNGMQGDWVLDLPGSGSGAMYNNRRDAYNNEMKWLNSLNDYIIAYYNNVIVLQNYFEYKDIPYMFTSMSSADHPVLNENNIISIAEFTTTEINLKKLMDKSKWTSTSVSSYAQNNPISQEDQHPNLKGNKLIAQALYKELMEKYGR
jgi:hypothetical protein